MISESFSAEPMFSRISTCSPRTWSSNFACCAVRSLATLSVTGCADGGELAEPGSASSRPTALKNS